MRVGRAGRSPRGRASSAAVPSTRSARERAATPERPVGAARRASIRSRRREGVGGPLGSCRCGWRPRSARPCAQFEDPRLVRMLGAAQRGDTRPRSGRGRCRARPSPNRARRGRSPRRGASTPARLRSIQIVRPRPRGRGRRRARGRRTARRSAVRSPRRARPISSTSDAAARQLAREEVDPDARC